jgi:hypothetical protein
MSIRISFGDERPKILSFLPGVAKYGSISLAILTHSYDGADVARIPTMTRAELLDLLNKLNRDLSMLMKTKLDVRFKYESGEITHRSYTTIIDLLDMLISDDTRLTNAVTIALHTVST